MPINILTNRLKIKNDQGQYVSIDAVSDKTTEERINEINEAGSNQITALNARGEELKNVIIAPTRVADDDGLGIIVEAGTTAATEQRIQEVAQEAATSATSAWLNEHIDTTTGYVVDDTLSISGAAADAKKTGDELTQLKSEIDELDDSVFYTTDNLLDFTDASLWEQKNFDGTSQNYTAKLKNEIAVTAGCELYTAMNNISQDTFGNQFKIVVRYYDENGDAIGSDTTYSTITSTNAVHYTIPEGCVEIGVILTTANWQKTFTIANLVELNPLIYLGFNSSITVSTIYHHEENHVTDLIAEVSALQTEVTGKQNTLTFDNTPTTGSQNPVTSGGIKAAMSEYDEVKNSVIITTDNLLDFTDASLWVRQDLNGVSRDYAATMANKIPVTAGNELYTALNGLSADIFGTQFSIKVRYYDDTNTQVGSDVTYSTITSQNPVHYTIPDGTTNIAVCLNTNNWQKTFTIAQLVELNPLIYAGFNSNITNATVYRQRINEINEINDHLDVIDEQNSSIEEFVDLYHQTINVFDKTKITNNKFLKVVDGNITYGDYSGKYFVTDYIPVQSGQHVIASRDGMEIPVYNFTFYNASKAWAGTLYGSLILANSQAAPANGYIRLTIETGYATVDTLMIEITESKSASQYVPYGKVGITYDGLNPRLTALENDLSAPIDEMFVAEAKTTIESITQAITSRAVIMSVITDEHYNDVKNDSTKQLSGAFFASMRNIKYVNGFMPSNVVVDLGDRINEGEHDSMLALQQDMIRALRSTNNHVVTLIGNHDFNGTTYANVLSEEELYAVAAQYNEDYVVRDGITPNAYMDFPYAKVRAIFYNTFVDDGSQIIQGIGSATSKAWLANTALNTPDDYTVVFMSHSTIKDGFSFDTTYYGDDVIGILNAYATQGTYTDTITSTVYDFTGKSGTKVACCISGHAHEDNIYQDPSLTFPFVGIGCAKYENGSTSATLGNPTKPTRERGKATVDLWDTVVILPDEKKVKFIRFGAGNDREVSYT